MASPKKIFKKTIQTDHKVITEELSKGILEEYGVSVPPYALATTAKEGRKGRKAHRIPRGNEGRPRQRYSTRPTSEA